MGLRSILVAVLLVVAACGSDATTVATDPPPSSTTSTTEGHDGPPPVEVVGGEHDVSLEAWTFCWSTLCADGRPPEDPPDVGAAGELLVRFPMEGWSWEATFGRDECGDADRVALTRTGPNEHRLTPMGPAGTYDVTLFGKGTGDLFVTFRWTTTTDGPFTPPAATTSIVADHDGGPDSYGVELGASHLATVPEQATAAVVVTSAEGRSHAIHLGRGGRPRCRSVRLDAPIEEGKAAAALGSPPFTYDVTLTLDGVEHRARATWPDDVDPDCSPCVPLVFDPPLPTRLPAEPAAGDE